MGGKPLMVDGRWVCLECRDPLHQACYDGKKRRPALRCQTCRSANFLVRAVLSGKQLGSHAVSMARRRGTLPAPSVHACADCGTRAECYDHRDYNRPLDVVPVCRSCNVRRGSAIPFNPYLVGLLLIAHAAQPA